MEQVEILTGNGHMVYFVFFRGYLMIFNYCFIYLIENITVIYSLSDTVKLGRPFMIKK